MFSRFFIDRPIFAAVISMFLVLAGLRAMRTLPIAQYPEIAPPVVTVQAVYPGASAETLEQTVAVADRERDQRRAEHDLHELERRRRTASCRSRSRSRSAPTSTIAAVNVNNRVKQVEPRLPEEVRRQGVSVERGSSSFLQVLAFYSPDGRYDDLFISNYVTLERARPVEAAARHDQRADLRRAATTRCGSGSSRTASRSSKLTPADVIRRGQRAERAVRRRQGRASADRSKARSSSTRSRPQGRLSDAKEFAQIIVRANPDGSTVRLADVARVELGLEGLRLHRPLTTASRPRSSASSCQPGANALEVAKTRARDRWPSSQTRFPEGLTYAIPYDTTRFVEVSIREVLFTLGEAMVLVFLVVYLFLQSWRATHHSAGRGAGLAARRVRRPATCSAIRSTR